MNVEECFWNRAFGAEQIDLKNAHVWARRFAVEHILQRRIRDETAVPIELAVYLYRRETRRQGAARHDVFGTNLVSRAVEIFQISVADVDRSDAETNWSGIQKIEVGEFEKRRP